MDETSTTTPAKLRVCNKCKKQDSQFRCAKCLTCYCCSECQKLDWPSHKIECRLLSTAFEARNGSKVEKLSEKDSSRIGLALASARATFESIKGSHPANVETRDELMLRIHVELVTNILSSGEPINGRPGGPVPIIGATERGEIYHVRALIIRGADVNKRNSEGKRAIDVCVSPSIRAILLENGATI